jgi:hypothetical protein
MATTVNNQRPRGSSLLLKSCLIITALILGLFILVMIYALRLDSVKSMVACGENMKELGAAIGRYTDVNGHRPAGLNALRKEYLQHASVLRCPLDKSPGDAPSYTYHPDAGDDQVMLECDRHHLRSDMPRSRLVVLGSGDFENRNPSFRETLRAAEKRSRR